MKSQPVLSPQSSPVIPPHLALLKLSTIASVLDYSKRTLERKIATGDFPPADFRKGQDCRWRRETVETWIQHYYTE